MNTERLIKIVLLSLTEDKLKLEHDLERELNTNSSIDEKVDMIKKLVYEITTTETTMAKFSELMKTSNDNNDNLKKQENGENK